MSQVAFDLEISGLGKVAVGGARLVATWVVVVGRGVGLFVWIGVPGLVELDLFWMTHHGVGECLTIAITVGRHGCRIARGIVECHGDSGGGGKAEVEST